MEKILHLPHLSQKVNAFWENTHPFLENTHPFLKNTHSSASDSLENWRSSGAWCTWCTIGARFYYNRAPTNRQLLNDLRMKSILGAPFSGQPTFRQSMVRSSLGSAPLRCFSTSSFRCSTTCLAESKWMHQPQASSIVHRTWTGNSFHTWYLHVSMPITFQVVFITLCSFLKICLFGG